MYLTHSIFIKSTNPLFKTIDEYAFLCKNLKNSALYAYRQNYFKYKNNKKKRLLNKYALVNQFTHNKQVDYCAIPRKVSQKIIYQVAQDFTSFTKLMDLWENNESKQSQALSSKPSIPRYLHKEKGRANVIFTKQAISKKDLAKGILTLSPFDKTRPISLDLGKLSNVINYETLQEIKLVKVANGYDVKIIYKSKTLKNKENDDIDHKPNKVLSVDFGVNNLITVVSNIGIQPLIIKGKALKSLNQYFNKLKGKFQSKLDITNNEQLKIHYQRKLDKLYRKRKHKINDYLHKASHYLINHAVKNQIDTIVIGYNKGWKQEVNIGKVNNQKFAFIPFYKLLRMIEYKAQQLGIKVIVNEESYTSKCSFLDNEPIQKHQNYQGKRVKRGLFKSALGKLINADVNGALNILRKVIGNFYYDPIQVCSTPKTINVLKY